MFKAIHALKFKEFQVGTVVENCVILHKLHNEGILVGNVHTMQHESVSVRPAYTRQLLYNIRTSDTEKPNLFPKLHTSDIGIKWVKQTNWTALPYFCL